MRDCIIAPLLFFFFCADSVEPDAGGPAGNDQGACGRSARRHRGPDQGHAVAVCHQGELSDVGRVPG